MDERDVFVLAERALERVVLSVRDEQWDDALPADFALGAPREVPPTLREVVSYHLYDDAWVPDVLAGRTMAEVGEDRYGTPTEDLLGADPGAAFSAAVERACAAARALDDLGRTVHCSFGDFPAQEYLWQVSSFRGLRAHDLALVVGADPRLPADLVQGLWDQVSPHAEEWRAIGVFGPAVPVPDDAPLQDRLLGLTGRRP